MTNAGIKIRASSYLFAMAATIACLLLSSGEAIAGWARTFGTTSREEIHDSIQTPDGGYLLVGATKLDAPPSSALIVKLDASGQVAWSRFYGAQNEIFKSIISLPNGNYLIAGRTDFFGTPDCLIVEVDPSGSVMAVRTFDGGGSDTCFAVARTPDGNLILAGRSDSAGVGNFDAWLLKIDSSYNLLWSKLYGTPPVIGSSGIEELYALVTTSENGAIAAGKTHSFTANDSADVLALRVDGNGNLLWTNTFNGNWGTDGWWDAAHDVIFLNDGSAMLTGFAYMDTSYDLLLLQLDATTGAPFFNATYGDASATDKGQSLVETPSGELVIAGTVGGATGVRALFTKLDSFRNVTFANVLGPATSASEFTANILDVASYFVSGYSYGYVPNGDAMGVKINDQVTISPCADITTVTLTRGQLITPRASTMVTTSFGATPNSYFLNTAPLATSTGTICSDETVGPDITVTPPSHNYGTVLVGQQVEKVFQVRNDGTANLNVGVVTTPSAPFSKVADTCSNQTLAPAQICDITARYAPSAVGSHNGSFQIPSNDPDENPFTVNLSGTGALAVPDITVTPTAWDFGNVNVGQPSDKVVQVKNDGTGNLQIGAVTNPSAPFSKVADACSNQTLAPTQTCDITTRFSPGAPGPFSGNFIIPSDDPDEPSVNVTLVGNGIAPDIDPEPPSLDFGVVRVGSSRELPLTLWNRGNSDLTIGSYSLSLPWAIQNDDCWARVLTPSSFCSMGIIFLPEVNDEVLVAFEIASNDPDENPLIVPLRGRGISAPILLGPANDVYASEQPTFRMTTNPTGIATLHYRVDISTDNFGFWTTYDQMSNPDGWSKTAYAPGEAAEFVLPFALTPGDYQWRSVVHYHNENAYSGYSEIRTFRVPAPPTLLSPAPSATVSSHPTFTMTWNNPGTPTSLRYVLEILDSGVVNVLRTYDQRISGNGWSQPQYAPGDTATFEVPANDPLPESDYYWRARAFLDDFSALSPPAAPSSPFRVGLPTIISIYPTPIINSARRVLQIAGDDLMPGATVKLVCTDCAEPGLGDVPGAILQHDNPFFMQVEFDLINQGIVGGYNLVITNPSGDEVRQAVLIQPLISYPWMEPGGVQGIAIVPETFPHYGTNLTCMMVYNFSNIAYDWSDPGFFLIEFDLTGWQDSIRFRVGYDDDEGAYDRRDATDKSKATVLIPATGSNMICLPIGLGVNPEKIIFPAGFTLSGDDLVVFGEGKQLTWKGVGSAGKDTVKGMLVDTLISMACGGIADALLGDENLTNLKKAVSDVVDGLPNNVAKTPEYVMQQVAGALVGLIPGVGWAQKIAGCMGQILGGFFSAFDQSAKGAADRLRARFGGDVNAAKEAAIEQAMEKGGHTHYAELAARKVIDALDQPPCNPAPSQTGGGTYTTQGPWDPNDKLTNTAFPCERVDVNGAPQCARYFIPMANATDPIEYVVRFENKAEATGPAVNVVITDVLDADLDPTTLNVIISSHPTVFQTPEVNGQTVTFRFNDINLPPNTNPPDGEGFVRFTVKPRPALPVGAEIRNKASIVFDFNPAIETPEVVHTIGTGEAFASRGAAQLPASAQKGATRVPVLQFRVTAGAAEGLKIEGFTLQAGGDGNDTMDVLAVRLFVDSDADGTIGAGDTELWSGQYSADNGAAAVSIPGRTLAANGSETYLVTYDFAAQIAMAGVEQGFHPLPTHLAFAGAGLPSQHRRGSLPAPFIPVAATLLLTLSLLGFRRLSSSGSRLLILLLLASAFLWLASCGGGGGAAPAATRSYQATLSAILAKGASTNLPATVTGTPVSGSSLTVQR